MIVLPQKFVEILKQDSSGYYVGAVNLTRSKFSEIFSENRLYFFEEYTDHGVRHINSVLEACANLITPDTYKLFTEKDISILVLSVFLHDLGMHLQPLTFRKMITGGYDDVLNADFGDQPWAVLWENYLFEAKRFNDQQRINIFGDAGIDFIMPDLSNPDSLTGVHRKLIGEFIRRHHPRIAYEVAFKGLVAHDGSQIDFCSDFDYKHKLLAGLLARSHGMNIRDTFNILEKHFTKRVWRRPINVHIIYLMTLLRLGDYFQIDSSRVLKVPYLTRLFKSPVSFAEHQKHLQTTFIQETDDDPETLFITAEPSNSTYFLALERLFNDIQKEVDNSWAVLGEVYGSKPYDEQPKLAYRRVRSNIDDKKSFEATVSYVPESISFTVGKEVPQLLVGPLYDYDPSFGVRELLQNAVDACWEREFHEKKHGNKYDASVLLKIHPIDDRYLVSISDNGKGMSLDEIRNYFLKIGGSIRKNAKWQHEHLDEEGHSNINKIGRFGIGVLAAYLLGTEIEVKTKSMLESVGYCFRTALEQKQVEIVKDSSLSVGTIINIIISENTLRLLKNMPREGNLRQRKVRCPRFDGWYVLEHPAVTYQIDESLFGELELHRESYKGRNLLPSINNTYDEYWHELYDDNFKRVMWSYKPSFGGYLICNGFFVPQGYDLVNKHYSPPALVIFDFDAKLPLSLDRKSVNFSSLFKLKLEKELCKDFISKLLLTNVNSAFDICALKKEYNLSFAHPLIGRFFSSDPQLAVNSMSIMVFCKAGFVINHPVFYNKIVGLKYLRVFLDNPEAFNSLSVKELQYLSSLEFDAVSMTCPNAYIRDNRIGSLYEYLFRSIGSNLIGISDDIVKIVKGKHREIIFDINQVQVIKKSDKQSFVYYNIALQAFEQDVFSEVVSELLGDDDLIIPYDIEDRKKKFPKAFKELEPYMRKYLKEK